MCAQQLLKMQMRVNCRKITIFTFSNPFACCTAPGICETAINSHFKLKLNSCVGSGIVDFSGRQPKYIDKQSVITVAVDNRSIDFDVTRKSIWADGSATCKWVWFDCIVIHFIEIIRSLRMFRLCQIAEIECRNTPCLITGSKNAIHHQAKPPKKNFFLNRI